MTTPNQKKLDDLNILWNKEIENDGIQNYLIYKPFSDIYWSQKTKICVCNLEPYGYKDCKPTLVNIEEFTKWIIKDKVITATKTAVFINGLLSELNGIEISERDLKKSYYKTEILMESMKKINYMNFRKTANSKTNANYSLIQYEVNKYNKFYHEYFNLLEPDILIIGGYGGVNYFNSLRLSEGKLMKDGFLKFGNTHVFSIAHFSRISYQKMLDKIKLIKDKIK